MNLLADLVKLIINKRFIKANRLERSGRKLCETRYSINEFQI